MSSKNPLKYEILTGSLEVTTPRTLEMVFDNEEELDSFLGWFLDGGGEDEFCSYLNQLDQDDEEG